MKATIVVAALPFLVSIGCARQSEQLTQQQQDEIKSQVKVSADSVIARWVRRDGKGAMEYYAPDVVIVADTMRMGFQAYRQGWMAYDSAAAAVKVKPIREDFIALAKNLAVWNWVGNVELDLKSGDTVTTTPQMYSQVMKKVADRWMVVFSHPSGVDVMHKAAVPRRHRA